MGGKREWKAKIIKIILETKILEAQETLEMKIEVLEVQDKKVVLDLIEKIVNLELTKKGAMT